MSKTIEELLDEKIPRDVVSLRDGGGGRKLSYLEGWYVIDRLNKIFGHTNWSKEVLDVRQVVNTTQKGEFPAYIVKVRLTIVNQNNIVIYKEAYGYGADKSPQNAHELAIKEAVTDALKVAAKDFGMSLGLALYDKTQENVDDGEKVTESKPQRVTTPPKTDNKAKEEHKAGVEGNVKEQSGEASEKLRAYIQTATKVAIKKGVALETIKRDLSTKFAIGALADATNEQLPEIKTYIDSLL